MKEDFQRWTRLAATFRKAGAAAAPGMETPPLGFATRVLALSRKNTQIPATLRWRRWAIAAAAGSFAAYAAVAVALPDPQPQFLPLPALDFPPTTP